MAKSNQKLPRQKILGRFVNLDYASSFMANPSSPHRAGVLAQEKLINARKKVAQILFANDNEVIFTSSGTEANNLAILGRINAFKSKTLSHIVTTNIEHPSVLEIIKYLERNKLAEVSIVAVEPSGVVDPKKILHQLKENTILVSVMYANNEIGTIQPIQEISKVIRQYKKQSQNKNICFHTDAVQAVNYLDLNVSKLGVDLLTISGAKIEKAIGGGVLYKRAGTLMEKILHGGNQEMNLRPGTENLTVIERLASSLVFVQSIKDKEFKKVQIERDALLKKLLKIEGVILNGELKNRLPNNLNITFGRIPSELIVIELSEKGIMVSAKSACKTSESASSYVITAIRGYQDGFGGVRFTLGRDTQRKDIDYTFSSIKVILKKLKKWYT